MPSYGSIDIEGNNNTEVVADNCMLDFPAGRNTGGIYSGGTGNLNIHHSNNNINSSVNSITSDNGRKVYCSLNSRIMCWPNLSSSFSLRIYNLISVLFCILFLFCSYPCSILQVALNMLYSAQQQQQPPLKKCKRDGSDVSLISETTMSCIGTIGTPQEYGGGQNTADQQNFARKQLRPESTTTIDSETNSINEVARRTNGVFIRDFVPLSLMPYFKVSRTTTTAFLINNAS